MAIKNWRECNGVNKNTGRVKPGFRTVKGRCPVPAHHSPSTTEVIHSAASAAVAAGLGRSRRRRRRR